MNKSENILQNPRGGIIDFTQLMLNPALKLATWEKYNNNAIFRLKINELKQIDAFFKLNFELCFKEYINNETYLKR